MKHSKGTEPIYILIAFVILAVILFYGVDFIVNEIGNMSIASLVSAGHEQANRSREMMAKDVKITSVRVDKLDYDDSLGASVHPGIDNPARFRITVGLETSSETPANVKLIFEDRGTGAFNQLEQDVEVTKDAEKHITKTINIKKAWTGQGVVLRVVAADIQNRELDAKVRLLGDVYLKLSDVGGLCKIIQCMYNVISDSSTDCQTTDFNNMYTVNELPYYKGDGHYTFPIYLINDQGNIEIKNDGNDIKINDVRCTNGFKYFKNNCSHENEYLMLCPEVEGGEHGPITINDKQKFILYSRISGNNRGAYLCLASDIDECCYKRTC